MIHVFTLYEQMCVHSTCCVSVVHSTVPQASSGSGQSTETGDGDTAQHGGQLWTH